VINPTGGGLHAHHARFRSAKPRLYESVSAKVNLLGDRPAGLILHAAAETTNGTVQIISIWDSRADAEAFERDRLLPVFESTGISKRSRRGPRPVVADAFELEYLA
jgi:hypothetical protein